jgi:hypothetical protein
MLDDTARKILTVLWNTKRHNPFRIDIKRLKRLSRREIPQIKDAINLLVKEEYLLWDKVNNSFKIQYASPDEKPKPWKWLD